MLRVGQKELVETYRSGYCGVPAIPGGGKTFALTKWAIEVITEGLPKPGKILIVTYMTSAVNNFKQRISAELEKRGITSRDYYVSTIHSLCLQIIKERPDLVGINEEVEVIDGAQKNNLLKDAITSWKRVGENQRVYMYFLDDNTLQKIGYDKLSKKWDATFLQLMSTTISDFKTNGITPKEALNQVKGFGAVSLLKIAAQIYFEYEKRLRRKGLIDFEDMLLKAKEILMKDSLILEKYRKKYTFVCEDEAQDSNKIQTEILKLIAGANGNFLRVGDSNQAIMTTFANSDMKLFKEFCEDKNVKTFGIVQSSRNSLQIIRTANEFVRYVRDFHPTFACRESLLPQYIQPVSEDDEFPNPVVEGDAVFASVFNKKEDELLGIAEKCQAILSEFPEKTTAVLLPDAFKIGAFINLLKEKEIPYEYLDNSSEERNYTLILLGRILDFIASPDRNEKLIEVIKVMMNNEIEGFQLLLEKLKYVNIEELFYPMAGEINEEEYDESLRETPAWEAFLAIRTQLKDFLEFPFTIPEKLVLYISEKLNFNREEVAIAQKVASGIKFLFADDPRYKLSDLAFELLKPKNAFNYFANLVFELKGYEAKPGVVAISTYHKAKGLEWDNVFLGSITADDFPATVNDKFKTDIYFLRPTFRCPSAVLKKEFHQVFGDGSEIDFQLNGKLDFIGERVRLLYVGITRAKERLFLSTVNNRITKKSAYFDVIAGQNVSE